MESDKENAFLCIKKARTAQQDGDLDKAKRLLQKSIRIYKTKEAEDILRTIEEGTSDETKSSSSNMNGSSTTGSGRSSHSNTNSLSTKADNSGYTSEQINAVKRVKSEKDYYKILGIEKNAEDTEIKKAYRKLALLLHPDKNKAPGATEAFKAVATAFEVLHNKEERRKYDLYGPEESNGRRRSNRRYTYEEHDIDPDEIFRMFFGGRFPSQNVRTFRRGNTYYRERRNNDEEDRNHTIHTGGFGAFLQFMPLLMIVLMSIFSNYLMSDPIYMLSMSREYSNQKFTAKLQVPYYVKRNFDKEYKGHSLRNLERQVEDDYIENLRVGCYHERVNKENLRRKGVYFGSSEYKKQAENYKTPSCDRLEEVFNRRP